MKLYLCHLEILQVFGNHWVVLPLFGSSHQEYGHLGNQLGLQGCGAFRWPAKAIPAMFPDPIDQHLFFIANHLFFSQAQGIISSEHKLQTISQKSVCHTLPSLRRYGWDGDACQLSVASLTCLARHTFRSGTCSCSRSTESWPWKSPSATLACS